MESTLKTDPSLIAICCLLGGICRLVGLPIGIFVHLPVRRYISNGKVPDKNDAGAETRGTWCCGKFLERRNYRGTISRVIKMLMRIQEGTASNRRGYAGNTPLNYVALHTGVIQWRVAYDIWQDNYSCIRNNSKIIRMVSTHNAPYFNTNRVAMKIKIFK